MGLFYVNRMNPALGRLVRLAMLVSSQGIPVEDAHGYSSDQHL